MTRPSDPLWLPLLAHGLAALVVAVAVAVLVRGALGCALDVIGRMP